MLFMKIALNTLPEKQLEVRQTLKSMIGPAEREPGCLKYTLVVDIEDADRYTLLTEWETRDDMVQHLTSHRFGVLLGIKTLLCEPLGIQILTVSKAEGMEVVRAVRHPDDSFQAGSERRSTP